MPLAISASNSDCVIRGTNGLTMSGASVWPMNTLAATESVSAPLVRIRNIITRAITRPLARSVESLDALAQKDLTKTLEVTTSDENPIPKKK